MTASSPVTPVTTSDATDNAPEYVAPVTDAPESDAPDAPDATEVTEVKVSPSVKFPDVPRIMTAGDIADRFTKLDYKVSVGTITNHALNNLFGAPAPDYIRAGTDTMFWLDDVATDFDAWVAWRTTREAAAAAKAAERIAEESAAYAKVAAKISENTAAIPADTRQALLDALLAVAGPEELKSMGILRVDENPDG